MTESDHGSGPNIESFPMSGLVKRLLITGVVIIGLILAFYVSEIIWPARPGVPWHIQVQVFDEFTNALADAKVAVDATVQITVPNIQFSTSPKHLRLETITDKSGRAVLSFKALSFALRVAKAGFARQERVFAAEQDLSDQDLKIFLASSVAEHEDRSPH